LYYRPGEVALSYFCFRMIVSNASGGRLRGMS
jgi:hypothetical protein